MTPPPLSHHLIAPDTAPDVDGFVYFDASDECMAKLAQVAGELGVRAGDWDRVIRLLAERACAGEARTAGDQRWRVLP